jgi:hypothetical protein
VQVCPALFWSGVAADLLGIFCLAAPDFVPEGPRISGWVGRAENSLRRLVGRQPRAYAMNAEAGSYTILGARTSGMVGPGPHVTTTEEKVEYLLRRDQASQSELDALAVRVRYLEAETPEQLAKAEQELKDHVARKLAAARVEYRPLRQLGAILFVFGVVCLALATFLA